MKLAHTQRGLSSIGWLFLGITVYFYAVIAIKIVPIYLDDMSVKSAVEKVAKKPGADAFERQDVVDALEVEFDINNIRDINLKEEGVLDVNRDSGETVVELNYEKVASVFKNAGMLQTLDIVIKLKHKVVLK